MNIKKIILVGISGLIASSLLSGCATKVPVKKEIGQLNLESPVIKQEPKTNKILGIVDPQFNYKTYEQNKQASFNGFGLNINPGAYYTFAPSKYFQKNYESTLKRALETSVQNILLKKGFKLEGPYASFDDITYQDKKKIYLSVIPQINLDIKKIVSQKTCNDLYCTEKGTIYFGGDVIITLEEPLTKQIFMKKRINLSDKSIAEPYIIQYQIRTATGDMVTDLINKASAPKYLVNNVDKAMTDGINKFYSYTINKLNKYLDREELLSYEKDIKQLKQLKRF